MCGGKIRKFALFAAIAAAIAFVVKRLRGEPAPQFSNHPSVTGGPEATSAPTPSSSPTPAPAAEPPAEAEAKAKAEEAATPAPEATRPADEAPAGGEGWVEPVDGACPEGFPVKAKLKSGIFHVPGGTAYERTSPDRCYATPQAAEADGLRAAKR